MSFEISSISSYDAKDYMTQGSCPACDNTHFHKVIFAEQASNVAFRKSVHLSVSSDVKLKMERAAKIIAPLDAGGSVEIGVSYTWGGDKEGQVSGYAKAEAHDDNGNSAKVEARQNSDGTKTVSASAKYDSDEKSQ